MPPKKTARKQKGVASKRQCIRSDVVFEPEILGNLWVDNIFQFVEPQHLLKLPATCKFFKQLFESLPDTFWTRRCKAQLISLKGILASTPKAVFISNNLGKCYLCHSKTSCFSDLAHIYICYDCRGKAPFETISPTLAQKEFHLKRQHLNGLDSITYRNPYRHSQECELFLRADVEARAYQHYGSKEAWLAVDAKSQARKIKLAEGRAKGAIKREAVRKEREAELVAALRSKGLEMRADSYLCEAYIEGDNEYTKCQIVYTMFKMKIVHEECAFKSHWDQYYNEHFSRDYDDFWFREPYDKDDVRRARQEMQDDLFEEWKAANPERYQAFLKM